ncbi:MAG: anaerobic C4-dicarboxylate transporter, partial [Bacteroidetes bacterium]
MIWIQFILLLAMIFIGSQLKGIGLGVMGMIGMLIFVLVFHMKPTDPPLDVMLIILSIVTTAASLQAAGGLDYLVSVAEKVIRSKPSQITFIAPFTVYFLCLFAGTAHIVYSLLPIIAEVSAKKRIRPERPLSISVIASHLALTGSPMSAATAALVAILATSGIQVTDVLMIGIPAGIIGTGLGALSVWKMGKELNDDPIFQEKMKDPAFAKTIDGSDNETTKTIAPGAKTAVGIFGVAILLIVLFGAFPQWVPNVGAGDANFSVNADGSLKMGTLIEIITLSAAAAILLITKTPATDVAKASLFTSMATAVVSVFGVVWMSATFMAHNQISITELLGDISKAYPWTFTFAIFIMGVLMFSQAATTKTMMPLGLTLGITAPNLIAMFPAVNSDFVLPGYPTLLAAINFDRTGSTKIG